MSLFGNLATGGNAVSEALDDLEARFEARIDFIRDYMTEEQLRQMQRSRPEGASVRNGV